MNIFDCLSVYMTPYVFLTIHLFKSRHSSDHFASFCLTLTDLSDPSNRNGNSVAGVDLIALHVQGQSVQRDPAGAEEDIKTNTDGRDAALMGTKH